MWRIENQERHNAKILAIVNTANLRVLQSLPGIGAKTAISIHSFRLVDFTLKRKKIYTA